MPSSTPNETKSYYITTPIYYVNDVPHIGHAYTSLACDMLARFKRLDGFDVRFLTGTDEHGQKVEKAAIAADKSPQEFVDQISQNFRDLASFTKLTNDDFIRTTEPRHIKAAQHLWQTLIDNGHIYLGSYAGWYAVRDEAFYPESELVDGKAPTGAPVEWVTEPSYFFRLSAFQEKLLQFYQEHPQFIAPESRRNEVMRFVEGGLHDLSVSRTSFKWGVPVPGNPDHIMYVWLDALTNYISAIGYPDALQSNYWENSLHVVGKDILRFQAVYWPAFLLAANLPMPQKVFAHGWWTNEGVKMSKSLGNALDPIDLINTYGLDHIRYFLLREIPFGNDGDFSKSSLVTRMNSDLANSYGNLVQRVLSFINKVCDAKVPKAGHILPADQALLDSVDLLDTLRRHIDNCALNKVCETLWAAITEANRYIDEHKPWSLKTSDPIRMNTILYVLAEFIRKIAILTQPLVPEASQKILDQLAVSHEHRQFRDLDLALVEGAELPIPFGVFPRFEEVK